MLHFLILMSITMSITFLFLSHPLSMGLILILQTIVISMITGMMISNFWFSYILLITMLSGALVLFIYMASVASNEKFKSSIMMTLFIMSMVMMSFSLAFFMMEDLIPSFNSTMKFLMMENNQITSLIKMFNLHNMMITIMMISYLFLTMIVISYIVNVFEGPLRTKN